MRLAMLALASLPSLPTAVVDELDPPHPPEPDIEPVAVAGRPMRALAAAVTDEDVRRIEAAADKRSRRRARNLATTR